MEENEENTKESEVQKRQSIPLLDEEVNKLQEVTNASGKVFVCGDVAPNGEKTVVYAVRSAKEVAYAVKKYLGGK